MLVKTLVMLGILLVGAGILALLFWRDIRRIKRGRGEKDE